MFNIFCANIFAHLVQPHIAPDSYHRSALDSNITYNLKAVKEHFFFFLSFNASRHGTSRKSTFIILKCGELVFTDGSSASAFAYHHPVRHCLECPC